MGLLASLGLYLAWFGIPLGSGGGGFGGVVHGLVRLLGGLLVGFGMLACVASLQGLRRPRVAWVGEHLRLDLQYGQPIDVPLDVVECFFLGQGPSFVGDGPVGQAAASNVVVRLAERAKEWHGRDVNRRLGHWCDGYITIRGAWCEPIDGDLVELMNSKLAAVKRDRRDALKRAENGAAAEMRSE